VNQTSGPRASTRRSQSFREPAKAAGEDLRSIRFTVAVEILDDADAVLLLAVRLRVVGQVSPVHRDALLDRPCGEVLVEPIHVLPVVRDAVFESKRLDHVEPPSIVRAERDRVREQRLGGKELDLKVRRVLDALQASWPSSDAAPRTIARPSAGVSSRGAARSARRRDSRAIMAAIRPWRAGSVRRPRNARALRGPGRLVGSARSANGFFHFPRSTDRPEVLSENTCGQAISESFSRQAVAAPGFFQVPSSEDPSNVRRACAGPNAFGSSDARRSASASGFVFHRAGTVSTDRRGAPGAGARNSRTPLRNPDRAIRRSVGGQRGFRAPRGQRASSWRSHRRHRYGGFLGWRCTGAGLGGLPLGGRPRAPTISLPRTFALSLPIPSCVIARGCRPRVMPGPGAEDANECLGVRHYRWDGSPRAAPRAGAGEGSGTRAANAMPARIAFEPVPAASSGSSLLADRE
jgi:hypothetical protein